MGSNVTHQVTDDIPPSIVAKTRVLDTHHLQLLICRPFDSLETPFEQCKIRYVTGSRFFVFDLMKNTNIDYTAQIQCVEMENSEFYIGTSELYCFIRLTFK